MEHHSVVLVENHVLRLFELLMQVEHFDNVHTPLESLDSLVHHTGFALDALSRAGSDELAEVVAACLSSRVGKTTPVDDHQVEVVELLNFGLGLDENFLRFLDFLFNRVMVLIIGIVLFCETLRFDLRSLS